MKEASGDIGDIADIGDIGDIGDIKTEVLPNGMVLLAQPMEHVSSAAMTIAIPAGVAYDPPGGEGAASVACDWFIRGAGERNSRQLLDALDFLGCHHGETAGSTHCQFSATMLGRNLPDVLGIYADILRRPRLGDETFEPCRELTLQDLAALEDEPARKCVIMLRERFYPYPLGRCAYGTAKSLRSLTGEAVREHVRGHFGPAGMIMAVAGRFDWTQLRELVGEHFGDWSGESRPEPTGAPAAPAVQYVAKDSAQTHIALAHGSAPISSHHYYAARVAESLLSGGMSSRLFTEVREKLGLAYHVSTRYHSLKHHAGMFTYFATVPDKSQQALEIVLRELRKLPDNIEPDEMETARTRLTSALVMGGESTEARASALAGDWYHLGRARTLPELAAEVAKTTVDDVVAYLREYPAQDFSMLTIGCDQPDESVLHDG